ncbi:hypothetical protein [Poseidonibacter antarcticus]|uniref:hypothetical protein n=1 Tax=Poseidonibacter antarcticus TaxID=2478538 RepID=UPI000EF48147|nr:hypothetical protein [Poseidonibacter antarcticus]
MYLVGSVYEYFKKDKINTPEHYPEYEKSKQNLDDFIIDDYPKTKDTYSKKEKQNITNIYVQQNINIQNNYYDNSNKKEKHTKKVWEEKGYKIKYGELYSSKFYGKELYTINQVEKKKRNIYEVKYSGKSLANKLLIQTKRKTKDILVEQYDYSEDDAKRLAKYKGY